MAQSTIGVTSPLTSPRYGRARSARRGVHPLWLAVTAMLGFLALAAVAADAGAEELRAAYDQQVVQATALESALVTQQYLEARAAIQLDDLRAQAAAQLAQLASTEGFLK